MTPEKMCGLVQLVYKTILVENIFVNNEMRVKDTILIIIFFGQESFLNLLFC